MDGAVRALTRTRRARRISRGRSRAAAGRRQRRGTTRGTNARQARRSVAPLARLRRHASLDGRRKAMIETTTFETPVGTMYAGVRDGRLCLLELSDGARFRRRLERSGE